MIVDAVVSLLEIANTHVTQLVAQVVSTKFFFTVPLCISLFMMYSSLYAPSTNTLETKKVGLQETEKDVDSETMDVAEAMLLLGIMAPMDSLSYTKANHPLVQATVNELQKRYPFGIQKYKNGPFLHLPNLWFEKDALYYEDNGSKRSVSSKINEVRNLSNTRWLNYLHFVKDGEQIFLKDYLTTTHGLEFS